MNDMQVQLASCKLQVRSSGKPVRTPRRLHSSPLVEHRAALEKQKYYLFSRILPIFICFHKLAVIFPSPYLRVPARTNLLSKSPWVTLVSIPLTVSQCYPQYIYTLCNQKVIKFYTASHTREAKVTDGLNVSGYLQNVPTIVSYWFSIGQKVLLCGSRQLG